MESILQYFPSLTPKQESQFRQLQPLYEAWNQKINLISRKDMDRLYSRHVLHSLSLARFYSFAPGEQVMDLGTGGGFPGIPLAILFPETSFFLVDRIGKKIRAVQEISQALGLENLRAVKGRGQDQSGPFDFVVSRAVAPLKDLWDWSKDLIRPGQGKGKEARAHGLMALKGGDLRQEIAESGQASSVTCIALDTWMPHEDLEDKFLVYLPKR